MPTPKNGVEIELRFNVTPNGATGEMDYSYKTKAGETPSIDLLIGTYPFVKTLHQGIIDPGL